MSTTPYLSPGASKLLARLRFGGSVHLGVSLGGSDVVLQAPLGERLSFDTLPLDKDGRAATEVEIAGIEIAQTPMSAGVVEEARRMRDEEGRPMGETAAQFRVNSKTIWRA